MSLFSKFKGGFSNVPKCTVINFSLMHYLVHYATEQAQNQVPPDHKEYEINKKNSSHKTLLLLRFDKSNMCLNTLTHMRMHMRTCTHTHTHTPSLNENEVKISILQTDDHQHQLK